MTSFPEWTSLWLVYDQLQQNQKHSKQCVGYVMDIVPGNAGLYTLHQYSIVMEAQQGYTCAVDIVTFLTDTHQDLGL